MARAPGEVIVRLVEEQQDGPWTVHESTTVDLSTGQVASISFEYELYRVGSTGLHPELQRFMGCLPGDPRRLRTASR